MAVILRPGQRLRVGQRREDETKRYQVRLQQDGNLVVYAYLDRGEEKVLWASGTEHLGANVHLYLNKGGWVEILDDSTGESRYCMPCLKWPFGSGRWVPYKKGRHAVAPNSDLLVVIKEGNTDDRFTLISKDKGIPMIEAEKLLDLMSVFEKLFKK